MTVGQLVLSVWLSPNVHRNATGTATLDAWVNVTVWPTFTLPLEGVNVKSTSGSKQVGSGVGSSVGEADGSSVAVGSGVGSGVAVGVAVGPGVGARATEPGIEHDSSRLRCQRHGRADIIRMTGVTTSNGYST